MNTTELAFLVIVLPIAFAAIGTITVRRAMHGKVKEGHNDVLVPLFLTAGTIYAVLLGFLVIVVWESYGAAKANAGEEASTLTTLYRQTNGMPAEERATMREHVRAYTEAVVNKEWAIQAATGGASPDARRQIAQIYREFSTMPAGEANTAINQQVLRDFSVVTADRNRRTLQAGEDLPWILWLGLGTGAVIVLGMTTLLYMDSIWPHVTMSGILAAMIGMLLFVTLVLARPFVGPLALDPGPFEHSLSVYASVDKGN
jgi:hypothetical protein